MSRPPKKSTTAAAAVPRKRHLLAMTDYRYASTIEAALEERWNVQRVSRTEEALWRLRSGGFDALLLGLRLDYESSEEVFKDVARAHPDIPVVVLMEPSLEAKAARALSLGAAGYVPAGEAMPLLLDPVLEQAVIAANFRRLQSRSLELEHKEQLRLLALAIRHEINNPLAGILGHAEMALRLPDLPPGLARRLSSIVKLTGLIRVLMEELETIHEGPSRLWQSAQ